MYKYILIILIVTSNFCFAQSPKSEFKFDCTLCHACENPTKLNPCLRMCPRLEIITVHHKADEGPTNIVLDRFQNQEDNFPPIVFSHRAHAEMSDMAGGCEMCHHYNPPGKIVPCSECHESNRVREDLRLPDLKGAFHRQCIDCHNLWASQVECSDCHFETKSLPTEPNKTEISIVSVHTNIEEPKHIVYETNEMEGFVTFYHSDHVNVFNHECTDCHQQESCARCHAEDNLLKNLNITEEEKHLACSKCHDTQDDCESCHRDEIVNEFNHTRSTGFNLQKYHRKVDCISCHIKPKTFTGLTSDCVRCHKSWSTENFNHNITGLVLDENHVENDCADCHDENDFQRIKCNNCHEENISYPKSLPGKLSP